MLALEIVGVLTGLLCVWLLVRQNIWTWPVGIANNLCYIVVFFVSKLYADMGLQFIYIAIAVYGWWNWRHGSTQSALLQVQHIGRRHAVILALITVATTVTVTAILRTFTDSNVPLWDASTTSLSLTAQYLQSRKFIENWYVWITADVFYIGLYLYKSLLPTAFLYAVFMGLCVLGLLEWRKSFLRSQATLPLEPATTA